MKKSILGALIALSLSAPGLAADYYVVVPLPGKVAASAPETPDPVENITVTLNAYALPAGMVNTPYSFDLNAVLAIQGDAAYDAGSVTWSVVDGATPEGIALQEDGTLAGTPTVKNETGASFEVRASYKGADGQQAYTIVVGGQVLQVTQISAGATHTCAVTTAGAAKCWGDNGFGQLGDGTTTSRATPVAVAGLSSGVASLSAGSRHTCVVTTSGGAKCWGYNVLGALGDGTATDRHTPVEVLGLSTGVETISVAGHDANGGYRSCALMVTGVVKCWGNNADGALGDGTTTVRYSPTDVLGLSGVTHLSVGTHHVCALTATGAAWCWGNNLRGQLGDGTTTSAAYPVRVTGLSSGTRSISAGWYHTCAVTSEGGANCWGYNQSGRLGDGSKENKSLPTAVVSLSDGVLDITTNYRGSCALLASGHVYCWGGNGLGQLGNGTVVDSWVPVAVADISDAVALTSGSHHTCALTAAGKARCWGLNSRGQLGDGTVTDRLVPGDVLP